MPTPHDSRRTAAFRRWLRLIDDDLQQAERLTGIARRNLERMRAGTRPPPVRLFDVLASDAAARGDAVLAGDLAGAASAGGSHA